ncbi:MAG TPA: HAMP domain-containing sensor histidine kinase [Puia sp.]|nr:HAMP domain-containing sensor histidine kinase [Puia sp.]
MSRSKLLNTILHIGVRPDFSFGEAKKVKALNFAIMVGMPLQLIFSLINAANGYHLLALLNASMAISNISTTILQHFGHYKIARTLYITGLIAFFTYTPIHYHNSTEYILILNVAAILLLFDQTRVYYALILLDMSCFIFVKVSIGFVTPIAELPLYRNILSLLTFFLCLTFILAYYRRQQMLYHHTLERMNDELNLRSENLENLNKSKEKIFSILSHDLRQPLISVKSLLYLMNKNAVSTTTLLEMSDKINNNLDHMILSLDNTLNWSINQLNGIRTNPENIDLYEVAGNVYDLLEENIQGKNLVFIDNIQMAAKVFADREQVTIILRNLLSNAIKFTRTGGLIHLFANDRTSHWEINVEDNGVGMDEETIGKLFKTDIHFTRRGTDNEKGTGLGLRLIKELIQMNEGELTVASTPGKGTIFSVLLKKAV